jgi:1-acyl-sn-glycerol-3-phosphate acyltransferase
MRLFDDRNHSHMHKAELGSGRVRVLRALRSAYETIVLYAGWAGFGAICFVASCGAGVLYHLLPRKTGARFGQRVVMRTFRFYLSYLSIFGLVRFDLTALDALAVEEKIILAPNHPSLIDAVLVISRLPRVTCIMKAALWDNPALGGGSRLAGYVRNDSQPNMVRASVAALNAGGQLLVFPEGTRSIEHPVNEFKGAISLIAKKSQAPVQTIFIESNTAFLSKHWPTLKKPNFPLHYRVRLGKRFEAPQTLGEGREFAAKLETYFRQELDNRVR